MTETLSNLGKKIPPDVVKATVAVGFTAGCLVHPPLALYGAGAFLVKTVVDHVRKNKKTGANQEQVTENPGFTENLTDGLKQMVNSGIERTPAIEPTTKNKAENEQFQRAQTARRLKFN